MTKRALTTEHQRAAGRARAAAFSTMTQSAAGQHRAQQESFEAHLHRISPDGYRAVSAYMRGPSGLRLLDPADIEFLRPGNLAAPGGHPLCPQRQRILYGMYVWQAVWRDLAPIPPVPSDEVYLEQVSRVQARLQRGLSLHDPLDVVFAATDDFCDEHGQQWSLRRQRKLFRAALAAGRKAAEECTMHHYNARMHARTYQPGQRRSAPRDLPAFQRPEWACQRGLVFGRPDLPSYHIYNILPQRPHAIPTTSHHPTFWLSTGTEEETSE